MCDREDQEEVVPNESNSDLSNAESEGKDVDKRVYVPRVLPDPRTGKPYEYDLTTGEVIIPKQECPDPCGLTCGWFQSSDCWSDVPKICRQKYGVHGGTYVWVDPCHQREFSKLVLTIVDYASGTKASGGSTKEVRFYLNADGSAGKVEDHAVAIVATVGGDKSLEDIEKSLQIPQFKAANIDRKISLYNRSRNSLKSGNVKSTLNALQGNSLIQNDALMGILDAESITDKTRADNLFDDQLNALEQEKMELLETLDATPASQPSYDFGPPTQFNGMFGNSLLPLQQQLNLVNPR